MLKILLYGIILGLISGIVWAFACDCNIISGIIVGGITGLIVSLLFSLFQKAATSGGNVEKGEATFATGSMMGLIFLASIIIGIIVGLIRWIFF